jgi:hypothetical protein
VLTKGTTLLYSARYREGLVLLSGGLQLAETHGFVTSQLRARLNISFLQLPDDARLARATAMTGLDQARRMGNRDWATLMAGNAADAQFVLGDWDDVLANFDQLIGGRAGYESDVSDLAGTQLSIRALRGGDDEMARDVARFDEVMGATNASQERTVALQVRMWLALAEGRDQELLGWSVDGAEPLNGLLCHHIAAQAAIWGSDLTRARAALDGMASTGIRGRWATAVRTNVEASIAALDGQADAAMAGWRDAQGVLRDMGARLTLALTLIDRSALSADATDAANARAEARSLLQGLRASALQDRLESLVAGRAAAPLGPEPRAAEAAVPTRLG